MSGKIEEIQEKSEDKKNIEMEEKEKMLNEEINKTQEHGEQQQDKEQPVKAAAVKSDNKEGMEVKPKKIPIGGIQMPGFFTRSKSKERCKDDEQDVEGNELIETGNSQNKDEQQQQPQKIKLPNPFRKSKLINEEDGENKNSGEAKERKKLLDTIRLPLVSVFPRKKKDEQNLETQTQAGLASMETLDDKSTDDKGNEELKNVPLDEKKDLERQVDVAEEPNWKQILKANRVVISALLIFILLLIIIIAFAIPGKEVLKEVPPRDGKYVEAITSCGKVEGVIEDSAIAFRGIPYARPPLDDLRFKMAQPLNRLEYCWNGTFLAHNATEDCLQIHSNGSVTGTEDCLTLDVVTPYVRYYNPISVVVLIGAESLIGGSPGKMRPSARYARSRDIVFVRPNFRLGALGFLALKSLSESNYPHTSGNYGLSDILTALEWVQRNIEHFGGDKNSVTLFGHQAGATLVTALATIPNADKYFARVWATSGGAIYPQKTLQEAELDNESFMSIVGCTDAECLRKLDAKVLVNSIEDVWRKPQPDLPSPTEEPDKRHEWLVLDGVILKEHPATIWANKANKRESLPVQVVIGTTQHAAASEKLFLKYTNWTEQHVRKHIEDSFLTKKNLTKQVYERYPLTYKGLIEMITDIRILCPLYAISTQMYSVPFYVVTRTRGPQDLADKDSDVDAILGRYEPKTTQQRHYLASIQGFFYDFVYGKLRDRSFKFERVYIVDQDFKLIPNGTYSHCGFWINNNIVLPYAALD